MTREEVIEIMNNSKNLEGADLRGANLKWADLSGANLLGAYLTGANLEGANIDFVGFDLACKSCGMSLSLQQIYQMLHLVYNQHSNTKEFKEVKKAIYPFVKQWDGIEKHSLKITDPEGN